MHNKLVKKYNFLNKKGLGSFLFVSCNLCFHGVRRGNRRARKCVANAKPRTRISQYASKIRTKQWSLTKTLIPSQFNMKTYKIVN